MGVTFEYSENSPVEIPRIVEEPSIVASVTARLAVITVTYSPGEHLGRFLDSLPAATRADVTVICADNGSTDGVPEREAAARPHVEFFPTGGNLGYGTALNRGIAEVLRRPAEFDTEYILISNPDVEFAPGAIDSLLTAASANPQGGAFGPRIVERDGSTYPSARAVPTLGAGIGHALLGSLWPGNPWSRAYYQSETMDDERNAGWLSGSCLLLRTAAFCAVGGFDERYFMYLEDVDLGDRLGRAGWHNVYVPQAIIHHDQGHAAGAIPERMLPAHHASAYRFQADRHPGVLAAPLRAVLWLGLRLREAIVVRAARKKKGKS